MQAALTQSQRKVAKTARSVFPARRKVMISKMERVAALALLRSIGPLPLPSRK